MANINDYLQKIYDYKKEIKQALIDQWVKDPTDEFAVYSSKFDEINTMPRKDFTLSNGSVLENVPIVGDSSWESGELPSSTDWYGICYGNGKFVTLAVDTVAYSADGITWTQSTMPSSAGWFSICYGNGKYVAVANGSNIAAYSLDGITWVQTELPTSAKWYSICYGNGKYVAVAHDSNIAAYSEDGINWTSTTMPISIDWYSVCYGNGKFVAVGDETNVAYSTDGTTWTSVLTGGTDRWCICYGNGKFVAVAYDTNTAAHSLDGITWNVVTLPISANWTSVCYGNGTYVVVDTYGNKEKVYSKDGITWYKTVFKDRDYWSSICYGNGKFVAVSYYRANTTNYIDSNIGDIVHNEENLIPADGYSVKGYTKNLVNSFTVTGTYGTTKYIKLDDCTAIAADNGVVYIVMGGGLSTSYERIYFTSSSLATGITLATQTARSGTSASKLYIAKLTGITAPVNITVTVSSRNSSSDYYQAALTVAFA